MRLVKTEDEILENALILDEYLKNGSMQEKEYTLDLIKRGACFVVIKVKDNYKFYPSRFVGYTQNSMVIHINNGIKDGKDTNPAISKILGMKLTKP